MPSRPPRAGALLAVLAVVLAILAVVLAAAGPPATAGGPDRVTARKVVYPGLGVRVWRASGQLDRLAKTSPGFRDAVTAALDRTWGWTQNDPDCAQAPVITVKEYRSRVAFASGLGSGSGGPGHAPEKCNRGATWQFFVKRDGRWKFPYRLGGQDTVSCRTLKHQRIPRMSGAKQCVNNKGNLVPYRP